MPETPPGMLILVQNHPIFANVSFGFGVFGRISFQK
jgi:hypothetical protein